MVYVVPYLVFIQICSEVSKNPGDSKGPEDNCQNMENAKVPVQDCEIKPVEGGNATDNSSSFGVYDCASENYRNFSKRVNEIQTTRIQNPLCTGVIYNMAMVLTSAYCVSQALNGGSANNIQMVAGFTALKKGYPGRNQIRRGYKVFLHQDFKHNLENSLIGRDIAVIVPNEPFAFIPMVVTPAVVALGYEHPTSKLKSKQHMENKIYPKIDPSKFKCRVIGWSLKNDTSNPELILRMAYVKLIKTEKCARVYPTTNDAKWNHTYCVDSPKQFTFGLVSTKVTLETLFY